MNEPKATYGKDRYPKWPIVVLTVAALFGLVMVILAHGHLSIWESALAIIGGVTPWGWILCVVICVLKRKFVCAVAGLFGLPLMVTPAAELGRYANSVGLIIVIWLITGAVRIAKPSSWWAKRYYGNEKMGVAARRFVPPPKKMSA